MQEQFGFKALQEDGISKVGGSFYQTLGTSTAMNEECSFKSKLER